jgi:hypothetical protein
VDYKCHHILEKGPRHITQANFVAGDGACGSSRHAGQATCTVRARRSCAAEALRVFRARSCCAGANVGTTVAALFGVGSSSVWIPFFDTRMHRSTCRQVIDFFYDAGA